MRHLKEELDELRKDPRFDVVKRMYLGYADFLKNAVEAVPVDDKMKSQLHFATRQFSEAVSPANFFATNPDLARLNFHRMLEGGPVAVKVEQELENPLYQAAARVYQRLTEEGIIQVSDPEFMPFSLEILLDLYFVNPERLQRALGLRGTALRTRMRTHFRRTFVRLLAGR